MTADGRRRYEFGTFTVDCNRRSLRDEAGSPVQLSGQAFDALVYLVENAGRIVGRAELMDELWPDAIVEDNSLSRTIHRVRRVLGEGYIVTVKGRGYQFVAEVRPGDVEPPVPSRRPSRNAILDSGSRPVRIGIAGTAAAVLVIAALVFREARGPDDPAPDPHTRYSELPTDDDRALEFYLSGRKYEQMENNPDWDLAVRQYQKAIDHDPDFALAWARLSIVHNEIFWFRQDVSQARRQLAYDAAMRAIALRPDLPEARMALGWYHYHVEQDVSGALDELERAAALMPSDSEIHWRLGIVYRRFGEIEKALVAFDRVAEFRPRDRRYLFDRVELEVLLRDYSEAQDLCDQLLEVAPDHSPTMTYKVMIPLYRGGDVRALKLAAEDVAFSARNPWAIPRPVMGWMAAIFERDFESALAYLDDWHEEAWRDGRRYFSNEGLHATTFELAGREIQAREHWLSALAGIEGVLGQNPDYPDAWMARAEALARVGERDSAIAEAYRVIEHFEDRGDQLSAAEHRLDAVRRVFAHVGALDDAFAGLETYLAEPGAWAIEGIIADPRLDPLRGDPRLVGLLDQYGSDRASR